jgi:predicted cupin superfamily sugar epimerase
VCSADHVDRNCRRRNAGREAAISATIDCMDAAAVIAALGMRPHPEGGWFVETWRADSVDGERPAASSILFLLATGDRSHWHRVDADEIWQFAAGDALELRVWDEEASVARVHRLAGDLTEGPFVQAVVPAGAWQSARPLGAWTLVGCIVAPAFEYEGFTLAPPDWQPGTG